MVFVFACLLLLLPSSAHAQTRYDFNIPRQRADLALIEFAKQANTTLIFPFDLAEKETANELIGSYSIELGMIKLLEGSSLYPVVDEHGRFTVRAVPEVSHKLTAVTAPSEPEAPPVSVEEFIEKIAIVGTRASPRSVMDSAVPLDIISEKEFSAQGATDLLSMMSAMVPSFNVNDQPINDASSLVRPANLRGMSSDHTLVLFNGKRRHRSAVITFLGGGLSDGAQGPDISVIPASALKQVEVLRDGAAAQYGSDAIAGVINFVLKDNREGGSLQGRLGGYGDGDGELFQIQLNRGFSLGTGGFVNGSVEFRQQNATSRSVQRDDAAALIASGNHYVSDPAQHWGSPQVRDDIKLAVNLGYPLSDNQEFYLFSNLARKQVEGRFYFRNPHTRNGVNDGGLNQSGQRLLLVADLDGLEQGISCPPVVINDGNVLDDDDYQSIADPFSDVGRNCFAFNELYPGGFTPRFGGRVKDASLFTGVRGETPTGWRYDVSGSLGYSQVSYEIRDTINPSMGPETPTEFDPGSAAQIEKNLNFDISREFEGSMLGIVNLAAGLEWRRENYRQQEGDEASYLVGDLAYDPQTGISQGFGVGSNGFPGYRPEVAGDWGRGNWALYLDIESQVSDTVLVGMASRFEEFTDFGSTFDGKLSARWQMVPNLALRGSINTGFKAPTVGQNNVINVTTAYGTDGLEDQATLPPTNPISQQLGATGLTPEESTNTSFGLVGNLAEGLFVTLDYFNIRMRDRISTTSAIPLTDEDIAILLLQGVRDATSFSSAKYFTNDFDTTTQGVDLVLNYETWLWQGRTRLALIYNWTNTRVDRITRYQRIDEQGNTFEETNLTPQRIAMIEDNLPEHRFTLSFAREADALTQLVRLNYFSGFYEDHLDASSGLDIYSGAEFTLDFELGYRLSPQLHFVAGAKNLFNNYPDENPLKGVVGSRYPPTASMGINGGFYYLRGIYTF